MFRDANLEKAIAFTHMSVALTGCWPLSSGATKSRVLVYKILKILLFLNGIMLLLPLLHAVRVYQNDLENLAKAAFMTIAVSQVVSQIAVCATQHDRLQRLIEEMNYCCKTANPYEGHVYQKYVDRYSPFYGMSVVWLYTSAIIVILGTFFITDPFPTNAKYPFPVDFEPLRSIVFVHQAVVGLQCAAHASMNIFCALLLLFTAARFEILISELRGMKDVASLIKCVKKYRSVKRYAIETVRGLEYIVLDTFALCGIAMMFSGISLIAKTPLTVKVQFLVLLGTGLVQIFMCALSADHLMDMSGNAMRGAYESEWHKQPTSMGKYVMFMLFPQRSVVIRFKCIIPTLSLRYFCSFISNMFSSFTALRIVMLRNE